MRSCRAATIAPARSNGASTRKPPGAPIGSHHAHHTLSWIGESHQKYCTRIALGRGVIDLSSPSIRRQVFFATLSSKRACPAMGAQYQSSRVLATYAWGLFPCCVSLLFA